MKKLLIIPFLLISLFCSATKYYVKTGGSDSNSGLDDAHAWAHHPWMSTWTGTVVLAPGDIVYMKRGDIWSISNPITHFMTVDQSGSAGSPITTTAYGTGSAPLLKISTATDQSVVYVSGKSYLVFDNLHIQHHSSTFAENRNGFLLNGLTAACHHITLTNNEIDMVPFHCIFGYTDCYNIIVGDTAATKIATANSYSNHIHDYGYSGVCLQGVNPANNESHLTVIYNYIHDAKRKVIGDNEYGIIFSATSKSTSWPKYCYARYNRVENIDTWEGIECHGGSYMYFQDNYVKSFGTAGIWGGGIKLGDLPETSDHIYIERNIIEQPSTKEGSGSFILQASASTGIIPSDIFIRDNTCFYTTRPDKSGYLAIRVGNVDRITISGNKIYNGPITATAAIYITDNYGNYGNKNMTITKNSIAKWGPAISLSGPAITGSINITNNIINQPPSSCVKIITGNISTTGKVIINNNVFIQDSYSKCFETNQGIDKGGSLIANNNIIGRTSPGNLHYWYWGGTISGTFTCDYNMYWNSTYGYFHLAGADKTWAYWTGTLGYDKHGLYSTNPIFKNESGSYNQVLDFHLQSNSPAINSGTFVGLTTDYIGTPISELPDIGAFEFTLHPSNLINNPPDIKNQEIMLKEEEYVNNYVGKVDATPGDDGQTLKFQIVSGNESDLFILDSKTGDLTTSSMNIFNFASSEYNLTIKVEDNGLIPESSTAQVKIILNRTQIATQIDPENKQDIAYEDFKVFPNPCLGIFKVFVKKINSDSPVITIKDMTGRTVYQKKYYESEEFLQEIDLSNLYKGIYIVIVEDNTRSLSQPVVIK